MQGFGSKTLSTRPNTKASTTLGAEKVSNGSFATDTVWSKNAGWTISGGVAVATNSSSQLYSNITLIKGRMYQITFDLVTVTSGSVRVKPGFTVSSASKYFTTPGACSFTTILADDAINGYLYFEGSAFTGTIDNVSVKEIIQA